MELVAILATVILLATMLTLIFAFASYFVSRAKRRIRKDKDPSLGDGSVSPERTYFERYMPESGLDKIPETPEQKNSQWI